MKMQLNKAFKTVAKSNRVETAGSIKDVNKELKIMLKGFAALSKDLKAAATDLKAAQAQTNNAIKMASALLKAKEATAKDYGPFLSATYRADIALNALSNRLQDSGVDVTDFLDAVEEYTGEDAADYTK